MKFDSLEEDFEGDLGDVITSDVAILMGRRLEVGEEARRDALCKEAAKREEERARPAGADVAAGVAGRVVDSAVLGAGDVRSGTLAAWPSRRPTSLWTVGGANTRICRVRGSMAIFAPDSSWKRD